MPNFSSSQKGKEMLSRSIQRFGKQYWEWSYCTQNYNIRERKKHMPIWSKILSWNGKHNFSSLACCCQGQMWKTVRFWLEDSSPKQMRNDSQSPNLTCKCNDARQQEVSISDSKRGTSCYCISLSTALSCILIRFIWNST
jgi:hypothetical protein